MKLYALVSAGGKQTLRSQPEATRGSAEKKPHGRRPNTVKAVGQKGRLNSMMAAPASSEEMLSRLHEDELLSASQYRVVLAILKASSSG